MAPSAISGDQRAVRFHPPAFDIRVETVPIPQSAAILFFRDWQSFMLF